jgi:hypothetical protein
MMWSLQPILRFGTTTAGNDLRGVIAGKHESIQDAAPDLEQEQLSDGLRGCVDRQLRLRCVPL